MKRVLAFLGITLGLAAVIVAPAHAAPAGEVRVVAEPGASEVRNGGGSATPFAFALPDDATCPGDSPDDNYRVQSFLVPAGTDIDGIRYKSQGPDVDGGWALYKTTTNAYIQEQTADAKNPGDPGPIIAPPAMSFAVFTGGELDPGRYHMGIACSLFNETKRYWSTDVVLESDDADEPAGLRWKLAAAQAPASDSSVSTIVVGLVAIVGFAFGAWYLFRPNRAEA